MRIETLALIAGAVYASAGASNSFGALVAAESFDYPGGSVVGQNGGTGFADAYSARGNVTSPGLTYPGLRTAGNKFTTAVPPDNASAFRTLSAPSGTDAGTLFVGFLASVPGTVPNYGGISFFSGGSEELFLGKPSDTDTYGFDVSGVGGDDATGAGRTTTVASPSPTLLVYRLNFTPGGDKIDLFVNPTPGAALPAAPDGTFAIPEDAFPDTFDRIRLQSGDQPINFDEFRTGTTFADVAPVPEPASIGLLAVGVAGLLARRRRAAR